jgi:hypothetical protein
MLICSQYNYSLSTNFLCQPSELQDEMETCFKYESINKQAHNDTFKNVSSP